MHSFPTGYEGIVAENAGSILLENALPDSENDRSFLFVDPQRILEAHTLDDIPHLFREIEDALQSGCFVAGFLAYECGCYFEPSLRTPAVAPGTTPLAWFGVFRDPYVFHHRTGSFEGQHPKLPGGILEQAEIRSCRLSVAREEYREKIRRIREYIAAGDTYQVNFTARVVFDLEGSPAGLYHTLRDRQRVPYCAFLNTGAQQILSFSPELFFRVDGKRITARPMKGTARRGTTPEEDREIEQWLHSDAKNRSENVMIVDLLRSDLGRVAVCGSVQVDSLFEVQKYETLFQMTSTVRGELRRGIGFYDIFRALFPCGSVTGAPKVRTMQIIRELEASPRGVYCGAIGYFTPERNAVFSVPIRTVELKGNHGEMGVGSGIVCEADAEVEYEECLLKTQFLTRREPRFQLIETLRWEKGYRFLEEHLRRLSTSARCFGFRFDTTRVISALNEESASLCSDVVYKVRLLLEADGRTSVSSQPLALDSGPGTVIVSKERTRSDDRYLFHKTTRRELYDREYAAAIARGHVDVLFRNERDELTEGAIHNLFVEQGTCLYTPPVACGLLPGIYREHLLASNPRVTEKVLRIEDLQAADAVYVGNSVRGLRPVRVVVSECE